MATKRGSYAVGTERRAQLLAVTEKLVLEQGHARVTVRIVAAGAGVSEAAVYHHFSSREELVVGVMRLRDERAAGREHDDLVHHLVTIAAENQAQPNVVGLYANMAARASDPSHPAHDYFADRYVRLTRELAGSVRREQSRGAVRAGLEAEAVAVILISLMDGLQTRWLVTPDLDMSEHLKLLVETLS